MIEYLKRKEGKSWLIAWGVVVVSLIVSLLIDPQLQSQLRDSKLYPGTEPPWYFIQRDFISSLSSVIGVITSLPFIFAVSTRYKLDWSPAVFMLFVCYVDSIYEGLVIFFRSGNVLDIAQAKVAWPTFGAYMAETKMNVVPIFLVLAVGIGMVFRQRYLYKTRGPSTLPSA